MWRNFSVLSGLAIALYASSAAADTATERARTLYNEAGELEREGRWAAAQDRLRGALALRETPNLHYALGWALENDDKLLEAKVEYEAALRLGRTKEGAEAARLAAGRLAELDRKLATIHVHVTGPARASARVLVDGHDLKKDAVVNPGSHVVRVERGEGPTEQMVYVGRGTVRVIEVEAREAAPARSPLVIGTELRVNDTDPPPRAKENVAPWLLTAGGIALVVGGAALLGSSASDSAGGETKEGFGLGLGATGLVATSIGAVLLLRAEGKPVIRF